MLSNPILHLLHLLPEDSVKVLHKEHLLFQPTGVFLLSAPQLLFQSACLFRLLAGLFLLLASLFLLSAGLLLLSASLLLQHHHQST
ncbi:unnamed protein product [Parnassius apollo]|uniref:(apollo) hypothetical protein n=1 Tax=Parnassius apollo TaxID=110799 RepID=A0A8S3XF03_PARAO|nr:unnamed protein product [Parnassius apollo]